MKRINAFGAMVALSVSLLAGCSSDSEDTNALVGTWFYGGGEEDRDVVALTLRADGTCLGQDGMSLDTLREIGTCTYEADASTLTFLTSTACPGPTGRATYTYAVTNDQLTLTNTSGDDMCATRKAGLDGEIQTRISEAAFGEWVTVAEGVTMMVLTPREFTPSEEAYAWTAFGPFELDTWEQFVRTTLIIRNEPPGVDPGDRAHDCETLINEGKGKIVDLASGLVEPEYVLDTEAGQQVAYDVGWGFGDGVEVPDGVPVAVETACGIYGGDVFVLFGS